MEPRSAFGQGVPVGAAGLQYGCDVRLSWLEVGVANGCFLVRDPGPPLQTSIEMAEQQVMRRRLVAA